MSRLKQLRSGFTNLLKFTRNPKSSGNASSSLIKSSGTPSSIAPTRYVTGTEGIVPVSTKTLLSRLKIKEHFLYPSERKQVTSLASAVDALLYRKNYCELEELKVNVC